MRYRTFFMAAIVLSGCGPALSTPVTARTSASPEDTFECVKKQLPELGYRQSSLDVDENRVNGTKIDTKTRRSDTQFRRILNKLDAQVAAEADGRASLTVLPRTFAEYTTQRGPTEVQEKASDQVNADAKRLVESCGS